MFLGAIIFLVVVGVSIVWHFLTANYPTHSDVFFLGVEAGALASVLLSCLLLIAFFLYRLIWMPRKKHETR
jgi:hypothetical protein